MVSRFFVSTKSNGATFTDRPTLRRHWPGCVANEGNPEGKEWDSDPTAKLPVRLRVISDTQKRRDTRLAAFNRREAADPPLRTPRPADGYLPHEWVEDEERITLIGKNISVETVDIDWRDIYSKPNGAVDEKDLPNLYDFEKVSDDRIIKSRDGIVLAYYIKNAAQRLWGQYQGNLLLQEVAQAMRELAETVPPIPPKDVRHRHMEDMVNLDSRNRQIKVYHRGVLHPCKWLVQGRHGSHEAVISRDLTGMKFRNPEKRFERAKAWKRFYQRIAPLLQTFGILFELLDPKNYRRYHTNYKGFAKHLPFPDMDTTERACWLGMALLFNKRCGPHKDHGDVLDGFVPDMAFGDHTGGGVIFWELGKIFDVANGSILFSRSAYLTHHVLPSVGERLAVVCFTKKQLGDVYSGD
ncbi:MAG: hypothetical protein M1836_006977 [Candelina mexicana]|nr:MAG: hypothetical protein M1836_006977 [Candelina mexicana]